MIIQNTAGGEQKGKKKQMVQEITKGQGGCASSNRWTKERKARRKRSYAKEEHTSSTLLPLLVALCFFFVLGFLFCSLSGASRETKGDKESQ
jgi:hypothetical protein